MNKFFSIAIFVAGGWVLADLLIHPQGVAQLGNSSNQLLTTAGNQVSGISTNGAKPVAYAG